MKMKTIAIAALCASAVLPGLGKVTVEKSELGGYLMACFRDEDHSLHLALSKDGRTYKHLTGGKAAISGRDVASQKGVRDPQMARGPKGFYLALTDLHIFAKQEGLRETDWERDGAVYGWGNNTKLVLMKSNDLVHWSSVDYDVAKAFPEKFGDIGCAWAPETTWDEEAKAPLVIFTMRHKNDPAGLYYAHTDAAFTHFTEEPKLLELPISPLRGNAYIDGSVVKDSKGLWHLFLVFHSRHAGGIRQFVSDKLTGPYKDADDGLVDWSRDYRGGREAPFCWKVPGEERYILMFDNFSRPNEMAFVETTDFKTWNNLGRFNQGVMKTEGFANAKHGSVIPLTKREAAYLEKHAGEIAVTAVK